MRQSEKHSFWFDNLHKADNMRRGTFALWGDIHSPNGAEGAPKGVRSLRRGNAKMPPEQALKEGDTQRAFQIQSIYYLLDRRWKKYPFEDSLPALMPKGLNKTLPQIPFQYDTKLPL